MRINLLILLCACAAMAQSGKQIASGQMGLNIGLSIKYKTYVEPAENGSMSVGTGARTSNDSMQRVLYDSESQTYFGYSMKVEAAGAEAFRVTFGPMDLPSMQEILNSMAHGKALNAAPDPIFPAPQTVHSGDTVALDLMVSPDGKHKIVDYLEFAPWGNALTEPNAAAMSAQPRDFTIDDGRIRLAIPGPAEFRVNGKKYEGVPGSVGNKEGASFWLYVPGEGRYILSFAPHPGFVRAGTVRDNVIAFEAGGRQYELRMAGTIAGSARDAWNLYSFHDAGYQPTPEIAKGLWIGIDRLDNLLNKR